MALVFCVETKEKGLYGTSPLLVTSVVTQESVTVAGRTGDLDKVIVFPSLLSFCVVWEGQTRLFLSYVLTFSPLFWIQSIFDISH
jgi:hypothetical protein